VPIEERRELLESASEIVGAVAPAMFEERRRQLDAQAKKNKRSRKFWRR